jgi:DNA-binding MarR family transcriptional regulator
LTTQIEQPTLSFVRGGEAPKLAHDLRLAIGRLARRMRQLYAEGSNDQLTFTELAVVSRLHRDGPASASQLANGEGVTAQAVGTAIGSLHQRGLVTRTPDPDDRRRAILSLTDRGRSAFAVREQIVIHRLAQALESGCTAAERRRLAAATPLLERLARLM